MTDEYWEGSGLVLLWGAVLAGPLAWMLVEGVGYAVIKPACAAGAIGNLWLITASALALVAAGVWIGWRCVRSLQGNATEDGNGVRDRSYFLAILGISFNAVIALLLAASSIAQVVLGSCE